MNGLFHEALVLTVTFTQWRTQQFNPQKWNYIEHRGKCASPAKRVQANICVMKWCKMSAFLVTLTARLDDLLSSKHTTCKMPPLIAELLDKLLEVERTVFA